MIPYARNVKKIMWLGLSGSILFGCNSLQSNQVNSGNSEAKIIFGSAPNQERAELYFYRPFRFGSGGATPEIYINQQHTLSLQNESWHGFSVDPGEYHMETRHGENWISGEQSQLTLSVKKGNRYFIRVLAGSTFDAGKFMGALLVPGSALFMGSEFPLIVVEQEEALQEFVKMNVNTLSVNRHLKF